MFTYLDGIYTNDNIYILIINDVNNIYPYNMYLYIMYWKYQYRQQKQHQQQQITLPPPTASSSPSSLNNSGELHGRTLPQQAIINVLGVLLMMALVFVTVALLSQKKSCRRNSSSSLSPSTMRYCRNGGQSFQLVPSSPAAADASDHGGRNGRMWSFKICYKFFLRRRRQPSPPPQRPDSTRAPHYNDILYKILK